MRKVWNGSQPSSTPVFSFFIINKQTVNQHRTPTVLLYKVLCVTMERCSTQVSRKVDKNAQEENVTLHGSVAWLTVYKRIGIIGGLSPESTTLYYQHIIRRYYEVFGTHSYPEIIIYSVNFQQYITWAYEEQWPAVAEALLDLLTRLQRAGADFAVIACNTLHVVFDQVQRSSPIPLLSIIDATAEKIIKEGIDTVGLLGTSFTMEHKFYRDGLARHGIDVLTPNKTSREYLDKIILDELSIGIINSETRTKALTIIDELVTEGAKGIVLGCTELPLLLTSHPNYMLFDTASIHAEKTLQYAVRTLD